MSSDKLIAALKWWTEDPSDVVDYDAWVEEGVQMSHEALAAHEEEKQDRPLSPYLDADYPTTLPVDGEDEKPSGWIPGWTFDTEALVAKLAKHGITVPPKDRRDDGVVLYDARKADYLFMSSYGDWREAEKQAGPVAIQASAPAPGARHRLLTMLPEARTALAALELIACNQTSKAHEEQFTLLREYLLSQQPPAHDTAPPSPLTEQDKEDAELTDDEILACRRFAGAGPDTRLDRIAFGRAVLRAARAKKEQP